MNDKSGIFQKIRAQAKKISHLGAKSANKLAKEPVQKFQVDTQVGNNAVEGQATQRDAFDLDYQDIHQLFRHQFPTVTRQLLGKRYNTVNRISRFVLPNGMDQAADEVLDTLAEFASHLASAEHVLAATGSKEIHELQTDVQRSHRAGNALKEVNKAIAAVQGAISGVGGLLGAAVDLPASVILSLKTIYEIGHAYGFELDNEEDQHAVYHALAQADLSLIAEKQAIFFGLRSLKRIFNNDDYSQLQSFLNSHYSFEQFHQLITDTQGNYKWSGFQVFNKVKVLRFVIPVVGGAVGAVYNLKLIDEVAAHADEIFSYARQYLQEQQRNDIPVLEAYQRSKAQHDKVVALASNDVSILLDQAQNTAQQQSDIEDVEQEKAIEQLVQNDTIIQVEVAARKANTVKVDDTALEQQVEQGIAELAKENGVAKPTTAQQSAMQDSENDVAAFSEEVTPTKAKTTRRKKAVKVEAQVDNAEQTGASKAVKPATTSTTKRRTATKTVTTRKAQAAHVESNEVKSEAKVKAPLPRKPRTRAAKSAVKPQQDDDSNK